MPPYRKRRSSRKRRRPRRRKKKAGFRRQLLGNTHACRLRYSQDITVTPQFNTSPSGHALVVFSANGLFNTRIGSSSDHQPRGFDELMAMYYHYCVVGSRCTVKFCDEDIGAPVHCGISLVAGSAQLTSLNSYLEKRNNRDKILSPFGKYTTVSYGCSPKKFLRIPSLLTNPETQGTITTNPAEEAYFHVYMGALAPIATGNAIISVVIEYAVVFSEPRTPAQS